jgi:hypothetical protein
MDSKSKPGWGSWLILGVSIGLLAPMYYSNRSGRD